MKYYLIDFENVGTKGFKGAELLTDKDVVHLFSTKNAAKISTADLAKFNDHFPHVHEVPAKNQSVDMHLVSYLGYLIGEKGASHEYIIVSNDTDYDNIIKYWKDEKNASITRQSVLVKEESKKKAEAKKKTGDEKTALNAAVLKAVSGAGSNAKESARVAKIVSLHFGEEDILTYVHNELRNEFGEERYLGIYNTVKPLLSKKKKPVVKEAEKKTEKKAVKKPESETTAINSDIQKALSKARYDNKIISKVASLVSKNHKNGKQIIYRSIVKEYGAETGLKIYNEIKALIK